MNRDAPLDPLTRLGQVICQGLADLERFLTTLDADHPGADDINPFIDALMDRTFQTQPPTLRILSPDVADQLEHALARARRSQARTTGSCGLLLSLSIVIPS